MAKDHFYKVQRIRSKNNVLWMDILRLAFKVAPKEAKGIMKKISENDSKITSILKKIQ